MPSASSYFFMSAHPPLSCSDAGEEMDTREVVTCSGSCRWWMEIRVDQVLIFSFMILTPKLECVSSGMAVQ